jgi:hypothetical protein
MNNMKKIIISVLFTIVILLGKGEATAQTSLPKDNFCQPSAEEVLLVIESTYKWSTFSKGVLIAGEVRAIKDLRLYEDQQLMVLTEALALMGGVWKTANGSVYLIRQSSESETKFKLEVNLREIKQGRINDVVLQAGDVIFVARGCSDGKLLLPTTKEKKLQRTNLTDQPTPINDKRLLENPSHK